VKHCIKIYAAFFVFLISASVFSQSCDCEISKDKDLREKFKASCFSGNSQLFEEAIFLIEKDTSVFCQQQALYMRATFSIYNSNIEDCKKYLAKEKKLLDKYPCLENQALYHNVQSNYYMHKGKLDSVVSACLKEQKIYEKLGNKENQATSLFNLSVLFSKLQQNEKRQFYLKKATKYAPEVSDITKRANLLSNIAQGYAELYALENKNTLLDTALIYADKAISLTQSIKNTESIKYNALGVHELKAYRENDIEKSIQINLQRKSLLNPSFHIRNLYTINQLLAERYMANKQFVLANKLLDSSKIYANKLNEQVSYSWYETKYKVLKKLGKYNEALSNYEHYIQLNDSVQQNERFNKINELETKYQTELKDAEITTLNQQKKIDALNIERKLSQIKWLVGLVILTVLIAMVIFLYFRQRSLKNKQKILETEQRLNRARINPHFFFNAMASLQGLAQKEKSIKTTLYTSKLAKIMRQSLENTYEEVVTIENEIDFLTQYLEIQKLRYPNKFDYKFHVDENLEINELKIPGMLMQPFVENAIEHGFKDIEYKGEIDITFEEKDNNLQVIVYDNGKGKNGLKQDKSHTSRAMQIIKDRLYLFNKQNTSFASYKVENTHEKGFKITVTLPKMY
jgi:hypothetical protein